MSPYRVIVKDRNTERVYPICAIHSVDRKTKMRSVYVLEKLLPTLAHTEITESDLLEAAYDMNTRTNSVIRAAYTVHKDVNSRHYMLEERSWEITLPRDTFIQDDFRLLSECLRAAVEDYIHKECLQLISVI